MNNNPVDRDEIELSHQDRPVPGMESAEILKLGIAVRDFRVRIANAGLHMNGDENQTTYLFIQAFEIQLANLHREIEAERASRN